MNEVKALARAIEAAGSQARLAKHIGVRQQAVYNWLHHLRHVPAERVLAVERITGVSRHDLRPDIYPREG